MRLTIQALLLVAITTTAQLGHADESERLLKEIGTAWQERADATKLLSMEWIATAFHDGGRLEEEPRKVKYQLLHRLLIQPARYRHHEHTVGRTRRFSEKYVDPANSLLLRDPGMRNGNRYPMAYINRGGRVPDGKLGPTALTTAPPYWLYRLGTYSLRDEPPVTYERTAGEVTIDGKRRVELTLTCVQAPTGNNGERVPIPDGAFDYRDYSNKYLKR